MTHLRPSAARGHSKIDWLDGHHTFSFGDYYDEHHMHFGALRVINEDKVLPGQGFHTHGHRDMEIITYVLEGTLAHKDSLGNGSEIRPGDVQRMSAGTGILHSEFNASNTDPVHFLQIWVMPKSAGIAPSYAQQHFTHTAGTPTLVASPDGHSGSVSIHQDALIYVLKLDAGQTYEYSLATGRILWAQVARGSATLNNHALSQGDGAAVTEEKNLAFIATQPCEILLFDLAA